MRSHVRHLLAVVLLTSALVGCGGRGTTPVEGVITLEGAPLPGATVLFVPDGTGKGRPASGFTSPEGVFRLTTFQPDDGALPGSYRVVVRKTAAARDPGTAEQSAQERALAKYGDKALARGKKPAMPGRYASFDTTPLRCTVPATGRVTLTLHQDGKE
jgi:hypothetical protein